MMQGLLFGHETPRCAFGRPTSIERTELGEGAWIELQRGWLAGHARVFELLRDSLEWHTEERKMYDRMVDVPRLYASVPSLPIIEEMRALLNDRYATHFSRVTAAWYRDGRDSVAWHGDYVARELQEDTLVATVSLGGPRKFLVRPSGGGKSRAWSLGWGDLIVMGGSIQRTHQHSVPKVAHAEPRIAVMFRPIWE